MERRPSKLVIGISFAILLASPALNFGAVPLSEAQQPAHGGTLRLALPNTIDSFSEFQTSSFEAWYFLQMLYPDFRVPTAIGLVPVGVQSVWSNSNATVWYFRVRQGMMWSDGVPANATDLAYSIRLFFTPFSWGSGSAAQYDSILNGPVQKAIKVDNASVVEIDLKQPFGIMGDLIAESTPTFVPYHLWSKFISNNTAPPRNFGTVVGAGPFYISNYSLGDTQITLLPNPYGGPWGGDAQGKPYLGKITVTMTPTSSSTALLLKSGEIDTAPLSPADVAAFVGNPSYQVSATPGTGLWYIEFPLANYPYNMTAFRQAMNYAIDKNSLVANALSGYGVAGNAGFLPPTAPEYNSSIPQYPYNVTVAKQLLQSLGFKVGSDGYFALPNGTAFQPPLYVPSENTELVTAGALIARDLQAAGINVQLRAIATVDMSSVWYQGINMYAESTNFGAANSIYFTSYTFYSYLTVPGPTQGHAIVDPAVSSEYNSTVASLYAAGSQATRYQLEEKLQGILADYVPSIPLFFPDYIWAFNKASFGGWPVAPSSFELPGAVWNLTALSSIYQIQVGATTSSTSSSSFTTTVASTSSSTSNSSAIYNPAYAIAGIIAVVVVVAGLGFYFVRRVRKPTQ